VCHLEQVRAADIDSEKNTFAMQKKFGNLQKPPIPQTNDFLVDGDNSRRDRAAGAFEHEVCYFVSCSKDCLRP
jgi:hypothetical protein